MRRRLQYHMNVSIRVQSIAGEYKGDVPILQQAKWGFKYIIPV